MLLKKPFLLAIVLNVFFLVFCLGIGGIHYGCLDDFFMSLIVTGTYGGGSASQTLFVNGVYAYFLKPLYFLFPNVGWYFIFEMLAVFIAFTFIAYSLISQVKSRIALFIVVFILSCMTPAFYLQLGFTQCAAVLTAAGILQLYLGSKQGKWRYLFQGLLLMIVGAIFRREGLLLGMPFMCFFLVLSWIEKRSISKKSIVTIAFGVMAYVGLQLFNQSLFQSKDFSYYLAYQGPRAMLGDGAYYDSDDVFDELEERGYSGRDFRLLQRWVFYDTESFSLDSLLPIVNVVQRNRYDLNYAKLPVALLFTVANSFFCINAWCWGILCLILFVCFPKKAVVYVLGTIALILVCLSYLLLQNRVVDYVENSIWLYAIVCVVPLIEEGQLVMGKWTPKLPFLMVTLCLGCFAFSIDTQPSIKNDSVFFGCPKEYEDMGQFTEYAEHHQEDIFLMPYSSYKEKALYSGCPFKTVEPKRWANVIPIGYWNVNFPGMKAEMMIRGVNNPLKDIIKKNVFVLDENYKFRLEEFYYRHYGIEISADTVQRFGEKKLLKYHMVEGNP